MARSTGIPSSPLSSLAPHETATVTGLAGGPSFNSRVAALGFVPGAPVTVVQNYGHGPMIVAVHQAHIALGRGEAAKIEVRREHSS